MAQLERERFFDDFAAAGDALFPEVIYLAKGQSPSHASHRSLISVVYSLEWPKSKGQPIPYRSLVASEGRRKIETAKIPADEVEKANIAIGVIFRTIDFFERYLGSSVTLYDVRSGCLKARYSFSDDVSMQRIKNGIEHFRLAANAYLAISVAATINGQAVRVP
jgi:hypothetical protein